MFNGIGTPLSGAYDSFLSNQNMNQEMTVQEFSSKLNPSTCAHVMKLVNATQPLFDRAGHFKGNGVAIAKNLVLTSGHCVDGETGYLGSNGMGKVIFDGSDGQGIDHLDFKILYVEEGHFNPITLDVVPGVGTSIQTYFKHKSASQLHRYVKSFDSDCGMYASRSDLALTRTDAGESGAPRMSLVNGCVHAIHQGESEGLKVNDIYQALEQASRTPLHPQQKNAAKILKNIDIVNLQMRYLCASSLALNTGKVNEEKARIHSSISFTLENHKKKTIQVVFGYWEIGEGRGNRKITIHKEGVADSCLTYTISPNPHANPKYNKGGQEKFYEDLAKSLGKHYLEHGNQFPDEKEIDVLGETYLLNAE